MGINIKLIKRISQNEIAEIKTGINDDCKNGYECFSLAVNLFIKQGNKTERKIEFEGGDYYEHSSDTSLEFLEKYAPELIPVFLINGCDTFGVETYPLLNGQYYLKNDFNHALNILRITKNEGLKLRKYNNVAYASFINKLIETRYKDEVNEAVKVLEKLSGEKYKRKEFVSPTLYNDLHYVLKTEANGWNVYKGNAATIKEYPVKLDLI